MSGKWTEWWDDDRQKWVKVYVEFPNPLTKGTATTLDQKPVLVLGPDGKPLTKPRRIGFQP